MSRIGECESQTDQDESEHMFAVLTEVGMGPELRRPQCGESNSGGKQPGENPKDDDHRAGIARSVSRQTDDCVSLGVWLIRRERLKRLPHAEAQHKPLANLHGIASGGADARLAVEAPAD